MSETSRIGFLTARAWRDEDGYHVWQAHDCKGGQRSVSKLPWPQWKADGERVQPSVICGLCGLHATLTLDKQPPEEHTYVKSEATR